MTPSPRPLARDGERDLFDAKKYARQVCLEMHVRKLSLRPAAEQIGISPATLNRVMRGGVPSVETFLRLNNWMYRDE